MAIAHVQSISTYSSGNLTLNGVTAGNLLIGWLGSSGNITAATCSGGGTWVGGPAHAFTNYIRVNYCLSATGGNTTVSVSGATGDFGWGIFEYSGGTFSYSTSAGRVDNATNPSSGSLNLAAGALSFGWMLDEAGGSLPSAYGVHTVRQTQSGHLDCQADYITPSSGSYQFKVTRAASNPEIGQTIFTATSGGGGSAIVSGSVSMGGWGYEISSAKNNTSGTLTLYGINSTIPKAVNNIISNLQIIGDNLIGNSGLNKELGNISLTGQADELATGLSVIYGLSTIVGNVDLIGLPFSIIPANTILSALSSLLATGSIVGGINIIDGQVSFDGIGILSLNAYVRQLANLIVSGQGDLQANSYLLVNAVLVLSGIGNLIAMGTIPSGILPRTPDNRMFVIPTENRVFVIDSDGRIFVINLENRTYQI